MAKSIKGGVEINLEKIKSGFANGAGNLFDLLVKLEKEGKSVYREIGEIHGKTKNGKEYKSAYGLEIQIGIDPKKLQKNHCKLKEKDKGKSL